MKKGLLFVLVILLLPFVAAAEDFNADMLTGEWFTPEYVEIYPAILETKGDITLINPGVEQEVIIHPDGNVEAEGGLDHIGIIEYNKCILLYQKENIGNVIIILIPTKENEYDAFFIANMSEPSLFANGKLYASDSVNEYYFRGGTLYIIQEKGYTRGTITKYGNDVFSYEYINSLDPFGEKLSQFFIRADAIYAILEAENE